MISCDIEDGFLAVFPLMIFLKSIFWDIEAFHTITSRVIGVEGHLKDGCTQVRSFDFRLIQFARKCYYCSLMSVLFTQAPLPGLRAA